MKRIKLLSAAFVATVLLFLACRKADYHKEVQTPSLIKQLQFFSGYRSADPTEQALVSYLTRQNDKSNFVEKTIKRIGYPRWNKAFALHPTKQIRTVTSTGRQASDSVTLFYVPFVLDSSNAVNASMVIMATATDTSFGFITDFQYRNRYYSPTAKDSSAERYALFFMFMNNRVFNTEDFIVTDPQLFATRPLESDTSNREIHFLETANTGSSNILRMTVCVTVAICTTPGQCATHSGGCDYSNPYFTNPPCCYTQDLCFEGDEIIPTNLGMAGAGGTGTGGSGGDGGDGGGGGTNEPPLCENIGGRASSTSQTNFSQECGPGWVPGSLMSPAAIMSVSTDSEIDADPCLSAIFTMLSKQAHGDFIIDAIYHQALVFPAGGPRHKFKVFYEGKSTLVGNSGQQVLAHMDPVEKPNNVHELHIKINKSMLTHLTKEYLVAAILHEFMHGIVKVVDPTRTTDALMHNYFFEKGVPTTIAKSLIKLFPNLAVDMDTYFDAVALGMDGMKEAYEWAGHPNQIDPDKSAFAQQYYGITIEDAIIRENKFKDDTLGFGTPYC